MRCFFFKTKPTNISDLSADDGSELWRTGRRSSQTGSQNGASGHVGDEEVLAAARKQDKEEWRGMERNGEGWRGMERGGEEWRGVERNGEGWSDQVRGIRRT